MSSSAVNKPLELDAVMRSIRPAVRTPDAAPVAPATAPQGVAPSVVAKPQATQPVVERVENDSTDRFEAPLTQRKPRKPERSDNRVQIDVIPAAGEATVGVYLRLPKSIHQQLKTVVFQNELTEQGHQSIADISREAISDWLARNRQRGQAA